MTDIKQTLSTAFDDEPPLRIDKAAILRSGRRKATFRRGYTGAAVLATVAAVAVPALLWSGAGGGSGGERLDVAGQASTTGPTLTTTSAPAATTTSVPETGFTTKPGSSGVPGSALLPPPPRPVTPERAGELGALIAAAEAFPAVVQAKPVPQDPMDPWTFRISNSNAYLSLTDVTTATGRGSVLLHLYPGDARCEATDPTCQERQYDGRSVSVSVSEHNGITLLTVRTATPDGAVMSAQTSNSSDKATSNGTPPPLTWEQLAKIVTVPGLVF
ncbi:hypothetical protein FHX81_4609 [Saccharothrix saharensis]|uniref:Uncharacterized protein n=1 Tax=Saccharothrix saharensis TaxID=571190 RepID=A0A543JHG0_9PSEU|nr:hypothetical protein [Saccharothrix saharensis]TQM82211.1 hypothetical protein FHX81_4609 [Saccharothrix saharensis]